MSEGKENDNVVPFKYKYCRMCGWELRQGVLIFGEEGKRLQIPDKIRKTLAILVLEEDSLPKKICMDCCSSLEDYAVYKDTVLDAQEKLTTIANNLLTSPNVFSGHCLQNGLHGSTGRRFDYSSTSFHQPVDKKVFADPAKTSSMQNESTKTFSSTPLNLTCKECGKKFKIESEFEKHKSISGHHSQGSKQNTSLIALTSSAASLPVATVTRSENTPPSPALSATSYEHPEDEPELVDLEDIEKESKISVVTNAHVKNMQSTSYYEVSRIAETQKPPFQCKYCGKFVMTETGLYAHLMSHNGRRFQCKHCDKNYAQKAKLTDHILAEHTHPTVRPVPQTEEVRFQCHLCPSYFTKKHALNVHKRSHTQSRPFECSICKKSFKTENCLAKHIKCHTAADTWACSICDKRFWRKSKLEEHENTHGDRRPYGCNFCVKTFNSQPNYAKHVKRKHKEELRDGKIPPHVKIVSGSPTLPTPRSLHTQISPQQEKTQVNLKPNLVISNEVETPTPDPLPLTCSTSWLDFTRKHQQPQISQQQFHEQSQQQQPSARENTTSTSTHTEHPMNLQQSHSGNGAGAQNLQTISHQHVMPQIPHNSLANHAQINPHQLSHSQGHSVNQQHSQSHNLSYSQHLQHRIQNHQATSQAQPSSLQQHSNPQHSMQSSLQQTHIHQSNLQQSHAHVQYSSHQGQQHYGHHTQQQMQTLPLQLSSQNHFNNHSNSQSHALNAMELMDCAIQSFAHDQADTPLQNHPMELSYKLDSTFQDMPMELTKVFQTGPLELCVRNGFNQLVDLTAKEHNFNERMPGIMDFRQQPMDLISRNEVCGNTGLEHPDNNNLVDLSLRPSFQEQSESSFLRDLIDLSSRSDYQGELNLSSKGHLNNNSKATSSLQNVVYPDSMFNI